MVSLRSLELRNHMTSAMNSCESEFATLFNETSNLTLDEVRTPERSNRPVDFINPLLSTPSWYGTICITGVLKNTVLTVEFLIDPLRSFLADSVVNIIFTKIPVLDIFRDVKLGANFTRVQVINDRVSKCARRETSQFLVLTKLVGHILEQPRGVVSSSSGSLTCS